MMWNLLIWWGLKCFLSQTVLSEGLLKTLNPHTYGDANKPAWSSLLLLDLFSYHTLKRHVQMWTGNGFSLSLFYNFTSCFMCFVINWSPVVPSVEPLERRTWSLNVRDVQSVQKSEDYNSELQVKSVTAMTDFCFNIETQSLSFDF